jgi:hypothetical protein
MQVPEQAGAVTPEGVRAGDPAALAALCERRGAAVLAYCREVCAADDAPLAAAEALARFRAAVWAAGDAAGLEPERLMLSATRHAAAARARTPGEPGGARRILGRGHTDTCARMPGLIVARAENLLGSADLDRLSRHLERCSSCRATEAAFRRAERAYVATAHAPLDTATIALLLAALAEAAPVAGEPPSLEPQPPAAVLPLEIQPPEDAAPLVATAAPEDTVPLDEPAPLDDTAPLGEAAPLDGGPIADEQLPDHLDDTDDDGWTGEPGDTYEHMIEPGPATWNATEEPPRRRRRLRVIVPVAVLAAGAVAAMGVAGVFDGDSGGTPARTPQSTTVSPATSQAAEQARRRRARERRAAERRRRAATNPTTVTATP